MDKIIHMSVTLRSRSLALSAATLLILGFALAACGDGECHAAYADLNKDRTYPINDEYIDNKCATSEWRQDVEDLKQEGRDNGWYQG